MGALLGNPAALTTLAASVQPLLHTLADGPHVLGLLDGWGTHIDWSMVSPLVLITILVALAFDFYNGLHDAANSIATVVATRALPVWGALLLAGSFNFIGAFAGTEVAATVGSGIIAKGVISTQVILAGLLGAIFWSILTVILGIPISSSQSLIGGLIGAALARAGLEGVQFWTWADVEKTGLVLGQGAAVGAVVGLLIAVWSRSRPRTGLLMGAGVGSAAWLATKLFLGFKIQKLLGTLLFIAYSPFIGFCLAFFLTAIITWMFQHKGWLVALITGVRHALAFLLRVFTLGKVRRQVVRPTINPTGVRHGFRFAQILSSSAYSLGHGTNDAQKTMGVISALLLSVGAVSTSDPSKFVVPPEVILASGLAIALGTMIGGHKIVKTMGTKLTQLDTSQGFAAETASAASLWFLANKGVPVSTTHSITGSILGVGAFQRLSAVSWGTARRIVSAWIITIPLAALVAAVIYWLLSLVLPSPIAT